MATSIDPIDQSNNLAPTVDPFIPPIHHTTIKQSIFQDVLSTNCKALPQPPCTYYADLYNKYED